MSKRRPPLLPLCLLLACQAGGAADPGAEREVGSGSPADLILDPEQPADVPVFGGIGTASRDLEVAWSGTRYLAVWVQTSTGIRFARIAADGTPIDASSRFLAYGASPAVAFFGGFRVAIDEGSVVELWRVGQQGLVSRIGYVGAESRGKLPDIAAGAGEAMIVFNDDGLQSESRIFAARYDGTAVSPVVQLANGAPHAARPHIAHQPGGDYLAVWENDLGNVRGRFVSPAGDPGLALV